MGRLVRRIAEDREREAMCGDDAMGVGVCLRSRQVWLGSLRIPLALIMKSGAEWPIEFAFQTGYVNDCFNGHTDF